MKSDIKVSDQKHKGHAESRQKIGMYPAEIKNALQVGGELINGEPTQNNKKNKEEIDFPRFFFHVASFSIILSGLVSGLSETSRGKIRQKAPKRRFPPNLPLGQRLFGICR